MNNIDNMPNYIIVVVFFLISLWGTYKLTRPNKYDDENTKCKCTK